MVGTGQNTQDPASFDSSDSNSGAPRVWHVDGNGQRLGDWVAFQPIFHAPLTVLRQLIRRAARLPTDGTSEVPPARALGAFRLNDKQDDGPATVNVEDPLRSLELRLNVWEFDVGKPVFYRVESPFNRTIWSISAYVHRNGAAVRGVIRVRPLRSANDPEMVRYFFATPTIEGRVICTTNAPEFAGEHEKFSFHYVADPDPPVLWAMHQKLTRNEMIEITSEDGAAALVESIHAFVANKLVQAGVFRPPTSWQEGEASRLRRRFKAEAIAAEARLTLETAFEEQPSEWLPNLSPARCTAWIAVMVATFAAITAMPQFASLIAPEVPEEALSPVALQVKQRVEARQAALAEEERFLSTPLGQRRTKIAQILHRMSHSDETDAMEALDEMKTEVHAESQEQFPIDPTPAMQADLKAGYLRLRSKILLDGPRQLVFYYNLWKLPEWIIVGNAKGLWRLTVEPKTRKQ